MILTAPGTCTGPTPSPEAVRKLREAKKKLDESYKRTADYLRARWEQ